MLLLPLLQAWLWVHVVAVHVVDRPKCTGTYISTPGHGEWGSRRQSHNTRLELITINLSDHFKWVLNNDTCYFLPNWSCVYLGDFKDIQLCFNKLNDNKERFNRPWKRYIFWFRKNHHLKRGSIRALQFIWKRATTWRMRDLQQENQGCSFGGLPYNLATMPFDTWPVSPCMPLPSCMQSKSGPIRHQPWLSVICWNSA